MKVLIINGSPRKDGNTSIAVREMVKVFDEEGVQAEVVQIGNKDVRGCIACGSCGSTGKCVFDDVVNELAPKFEEADGLVVARRGGCSATFDELNKYFTISNMPVASSQYWNSAHGREKGEANKDAEGLQTMRVLARNMSFLMKSISLGKEKYGLPKTEEHAWTHFIMD